jgi:hypothetical protein
MDQRTKNIRLLLSLVALIGCTIVFLVVTSYQYEGVDKTLFQVKELEVVNKIVIANQYETITLQLDGARWRVNDKLADRNMIDVLFATLQQAEPKRPVAAALRDSVNQRMNENGTRVTLFIGDEQVHEFLMMGNELKTQTYFKYPSELTAYAMSIPGYRVYVGGIFELPRTGWLDKFVFNFNWRNFKDLSVEFPGQPAESFDVHMGTDYFTIPSLSAVDTTRLNNFLDAVSLLTVNSFAPNMDSVLTESPRLIITVRDVANNAYVLKILPTQFPGEGVLGLVGDNQAAFFSQEQVDELMKPRSYFGRK